MNVAIPPIPLHAFMAWAEPTQYYCTIFKNSGRYFLVIQYCAGDKIDTNEMGVECRTYGGEKTHIQGFDGET
jgi:hypothetical protein